MIESVPAGTNMTLVFDSENYERDYDALSPESSAQELIAFAVRYFNALPAWRPDGMLSIVTTVGIDEVMNQSNMENAAFLTQSKQTLYQKITDYHYLLRPTPVLRITPFQYIYDIFTKLQQGGNLLLILQSRGANTHAAV